MMTSPTRVDLISRFSADGRAVDSVDLIMGWYPSGNTASITWVDSGSRSDSLDAMHMLLLTDPKYQWIWNDSGMISYLKTYANNTIGRKNIKLHRLACDKLEELGHERF